MKLRLMTLLCLLTLLAYATAQDDHNTDGNNDSKIVVNVMFGNTGSPEIQQEIADAFMQENPDIHIELLEGPEQTDELLALYLQFFETESDEIDVMQLDVIWPGIIGQFMIDMNEYGAAEITDQHIPSLIENNTVDGKLVAVPWFTDVGLLYYRSDLLEKYGYDAPPATWDELENMAKTIQEGERQDNPDFWGYVWQADAYEGLTVNALELIASHGGGHIVEEDGSVSINNPGALAALERALGWLDVISLPGVLGFNEEASRNFWQAGNVAFMRNWPYAYSLSNDEESLIAGKVGITTLPTTGDAAESGVLGGWGLGVSKFSAHPEAAAKVALYYTSAEAQKIRSIKESYSPTITSLYEDPEVLEANTFYDTLQVALENPVARPAAPTAPHYFDVSRLFYSAIYDVLQGTLSPEDALATLEIDITDLLQESGE